MPQTSPSSRPALTIAVCSLVPLYFGATDCGFWSLLVTGALVCWVVSKIEGNTRRDPHDPGLLITFAGTWMWTTALGILFPYGFLLVVALGVIAFQIFWSRR